MFEYESVLTRSEHLEAVGITASDMETVLDALAAVAEPVTLRFLWRPQLRDPADEMVLETAVNGGAERLATFNLKHFEEAAAGFGILAATPAAIWKEVQTYEAK